MTSEENHVFVDRSASKINTEWIGKINDEKARKIQKTIRSKVKSKIPGL